MASGKATKATVPAQPAAPEAPASVSTVYGPVPVKESKSYFVMSKDGDDPERDFLDQMYIPKRLLKLWQTTRVKITMEPVYDE